jgi:predicted  nucleic acid-binding Zn-ribbon protein
MKYSIVAKPELVTEQEKMDFIQQSLNMIENKLDSEITARQKTIDLQEKEIHRLHKIGEEKSNHILELNEKLVECMHNNEGSRQLINKLLNDIDRLQQDIEWYKRTYEKRSFLGIIKEIIRKK